MIYVCVALIFVPKFYLCINTNLTHDSDTSTCMIIHHDSSKMKGLDCESFDKILDKFAPMFWGHTPFDESGFIVEFEYITGRKREVEPADCLGLVLLFILTEIFKYMLWVIADYWDRSLY